MNNFDLFDKEISTERLKLRKLQREDSNDIFEYTCLSETSKYLSWSSHECIDETNTFIERTIKDYNVGRARYTWGIELEEEKK